MSGNITTKREIERLLAGEEIVKEIRQELTYQEMYQSVENIWSLLFTTGLSNTKAATGMPVITNLQFRIWKYGIFLKRRSWNILRKVLQKTEIR